MPDQTYEQLPTYDDEQGEKLLSNYDYHGALDIHRATKRHEFSRFAASIAQDRYSAGSFAAQLAIFLMLKFGYDAANNFADDVSHHEG